MHFLRTVYSEITPYGWGQFQDAPRLVQTTASGANSRPSTGALLVFSQFSNTPA